MAWPIRRVFRMIWATLCVIVLLGLPWTIWAFRGTGQAWVVGGIFVLLAIPISIYEVALHTEYYVKPHLQRHIIRILWMVPVYGLNAWLALRFNESAPYLDSVRECYEAYVVYNFFLFLMHYLEEKVGDLEAYMETLPPMHHLWPFEHIVRPWAMKKEFLWECKKGVLNYVIIRPICAAIAAIATVFGLERQGFLSPSSLYTYLSVATSLSQLWALYCLVLLYRTLHDDLAQIRPLSKFLCIKAIIFLTFWQGMIIHILVGYGIIPPSDEPHDATPAQIQNGQMLAAERIQDFLICVEMLIAALAHAYAFPPKDYMNIAQQDLMTQRSFLANLRAMFDVRDVMGDVRTVMGEHVGDVATTTNQVLKFPKKTASKLKRIFKGYSRSSPTPSSPYQYCHLATFSPEESPDGIGPKSHSHLVTVSTTSAQQLSGALLESEDEEHPLVHEVTEGGQLQSFEVRHVETSRIHIEEPLSSNGYSRLLTADLHAPKDSVAEARVAGRVGLHSVHLGVTGGTPAEASLGPQGVEQGEGLGPMLSEHRGVSGSTLPEASLGPHDGEGRSVVVQRLGVHRGVAGVTPAEASLALDEGDWVARGERVGILRKVEEEGTELLGPGELRRSHVPELTAANLGKGDKKGGDGKEEEGGGE